MYVTDGNIESLMTWFEKSSYSYLCMFVVGNIDDAQVIEGLFNNKEIFDVVTGRKIALFLFTPNLKESILVANESLSEGKAIAGKVLIPQDYLRTSNVRVTELSDSIRKNVIRSSQSISREICDYFGIDISEVPCLLITTRGGYYEPIVVSTKGETDIRILFEFFKELNKITSSTPDIDPIREIIDASLKKINWYQS